MEASSALLALCAGNSPVTGEFPSQRASNEDFDVALVQVRMSYQTYTWPVIWDYMTFIWRHRNASKLKGTLVI